MLYAILFYGLLAAVLLAMMLFLPRVRKDIRLKKQKQHTFAVRNVGTGLCIRPYNADYSEGNKVILYPLHNWECITWQFIRVAGDTYILQNLYTHKSFAPNPGAKEGSTLWQKSLDGTQNQCWEFIKSDAGFLIRLKGTELYLTASRREENAEIVLQAANNAEEQVWELLPQQPII